MHEIYDAPGYNLTLMEDYKEYIKRLIIKIDKPIGMIYTIGNMKIFKSNLIQKSTN